MSEKVVDLVDEKLLSISEAAKLLDVSENTLRDWDGNGKLKAARSEGGHRRYSLEQIRKFLNRNEAEERLVNKLATNGIVKSAVEEWKDSVYLEGAISELEKIQLATLLTNFKEYHTKSPENYFITLDQGLWLTQQIFLRCRFKRMVSMQPLIGPAGLVFYTKQKPNGSISIEEDAVCAKTFKLEMEMFSKGVEFESIKEAYANTLAYELEVLLLEKLPPIKTENLVLIGKAFKLKNLYDYIIAPGEVFQDLKLLTNVEGVDLFEIDVMLDPESFMPIAKGGRYPLSNLQVPIFMPYNLVHVGPQKFSSRLRSVLTRYAWYEGDVLK